jgi:hypothetical protein
MRRIRKLQLHLCALLLASVVLLPTLGVFGPLWSQDDPVLIPRKDAPAEASGPSGVSVDSANAPVSGTGSLLDDKVTVSFIVLGMLIGGFLLLLVEIALIPGFGIVGIKGILLILVGLFLAFWKLDSRTAAIYALLSFMALIGLSLWFVFIFPHTRLGKRFILQTRISTEEGYTTGVDLSRYVGQEGVTTSDLRPSGIARIGDDRIDVMSDGDFIPKGTKIKAVRCKSGNIVVIPLDAETPPPTA